MGPSTALPSRLVLAGALLAVSACVPPSGLSYPSPATGVVGLPLSLAPTVTGFVTSYAVAPPLPPGLALSATSGLISGTPTAAAPQATYTVTASNARGSTAFALVLTVEPGPGVHLAAVASDPDGNALTYEWRTTDGRILAASGAAADWALPAGPGLHFAYVLVSNGKGGYVERRVAVSTDAIGRPLAVPPAQTLQAPAAPAPPSQAHAYRTFVDDTSQSTMTFAGGGTYFQRIPLPDVLVRLSDVLSGTTYPPSGAVRSDSAGEVVFQGVPALSQARLDCSLDGGQSFGNCSGTAFNAYRDFVTLTDTSADTDYASVSPALPSWMTPMPSWVEVGYSLSDGSPCGTHDPFFGKDVTATAAVLDASGATVAGPVRFNRFRSRLKVFAQGSNLSVVLRCEGAQARIDGLTPATEATAGGGNVLATLTTGSSRPAISAMTATFAGQSVGLFLPPPSGLPSDDVPAPDFFLTYKGLDTRMGACQYYKAVGAVRDCDAAGGLVGAVSFDDWQRSVKIGPYAAPGTPEYAATYVNLWDLNLTRRHHSISYGNGQTAAYVCNHLGPPFVATQAQVDTAIDAAVAGNNLVACVAMDYSATPGVNGGDPFIRFLIFGPSGELLPSVNLDGRAEKFVPGTCVICHGGDRHAGAYPEDGSGFASLGAHFLPYDTANFAFSSKPGLTEVDQADQIFNLNQNVLLAGPTQQERDLIAGWYASGTHTLDKGYVSPGWQGRPGGPDTYLKVYAHSCRGCHIAMPDRYNFEVTGFTTTNAGPTACAYSPGSLMAFPELNRWNSMPNSLITFNRFWGSQGTAEDQPAILNDYLGGPTYQLTCRRLPH